MRTMPRTRELDATFALLREGARFVPDRCTRLQTDVFETRLLFQRTICMRGAEAGRLFYDESRFRRAGAGPGRLADDAGELFRSIVTEDAVRGLADRTRATWRASAGRWVSPDAHTLRGAVTALHVHAACGWAGVPVDEDESRRCGNDLLAMVEGAGEIGLRYLRGRFGRWRAERFARRWIRRHRSGWMPDVDSPLGRIASHRDRRGCLLPVHTAGVELLNVLRPAVAAARFVAFAATALERFPASAGFLRDATPNARDAHLQAFVQEVRRFYPFLPFANGRVRRTFEWNGMAFPEGTRVLFDLYGTDHHPLRWEEPDVFRPERFLVGAPGPYDFVAWGGPLQRRSPDEAITLALMEVGVEFLLRHLCPASAQALTVLRMLRADARVDLTP